MIGEDYYPALQTVGRTLHNYQICFIVLANLVNWMGGFILLWLALLWVFSYSGSNTWKILTPCLTVLPHSTPCKCSACSGIYCPGNTGHGQADAIRVHGAVWVCRLLHSICDHKSQSQYLGFHSAFFHSIPRWVWAKCIHSFFFSKCLRS